MRQKSLELVVSVTDFGASPNVDCTANVNAAIAFLIRSGGGTLYFPPGTWKISETTGKAEIPAHDDGTVSTGSPLPAEPVFHQAYSCAIPAGIPIKLMGTPGSSIIDGGYTYGDADLNQNIIFCVPDLNATIYSFRMEGLQFSNCFAAFACMDATLALSTFQLCSFENCAIALWIGRSIERCRFDNLWFQGTGVGVLCGGQWRTRTDNYNEAGGFCDKSSFTNISYNYSRVAGDAEVQIDAWFDTYFFKTINTTTRLGPPVQASSVVTPFKFRGICGWCILVMARYGRQSNCNNFHQIAHAFSQRPAIRVDQCHSSHVSVLYLEGVGYQDPFNRTNPVGVGFTDPWLGSGVILPYAALGGFANDSSAIGVQGQFVYADQLVQPNPAVEPDKTYSSTIVTGNSKRIITGDATFPGNVEFSNPITVDGKGPSHINGVTTRGFGFNGTSAVDTGISVDAGNAGAILLCLASVNTGTGNATSTGIYMIRFGYDGGNMSSLLISGADIVTFAKSGTNTLTIQGKLTGNGSLVFLGNK